ncbi:MAG: VOC family protein, partial [Phenylobacterium sp.]|nr:VOC family protein [Phenylobacterium sp.]
MSDFVHPDEIRSRFSAAPSAMYRAEVPQYGELLALVAEINAGVLKADPAAADRLAASGELARLSEERHGAIRVGTADELATIARAFAVMGMAPVSYYNLAPAGVPVHSTAFRPVDPAALARNPFRVFCSLLRLELIEDEALRAEAAAALARRDIFTPGARTLIETAETAGGLDEAQTDRFVSELLETFRWHAQATVSAPTYERLVAAHRLIADVVSFKGPHINHLTPRTLDIDAAQAAMPERGITPKETIEGPPDRACAILLRQTSFKALQEAIAFPDADGTTQGVHTARFGEIEQRGCALTPVGRALYDAALANKDFS